MNREDMKQAILETFQEMAAVLGFKKVTLDMLAKKCGISKKTVYAHFKDKDEIVRYAADNIMAILREQVYHLNESVNNPLEKLNLLFDLSLEFAGNIPEVTLFDIKHFYPQIQRELDDFIEEISNLSIDSLQEGATRGLFKDINPNLVITFVIGAANAVLNTDCLLKYGIAPEEALTGFRQLILTGLLREE